MGGGRGESTTYKGFAIHHPKRWHVVAGKSLSAIMWAKQDGPVVLVNYLSQKYGLLIVSMYSLWYGLKLRRVGVILGKDMV